MWFVDVLLVGFKYIVITYGLFQYLFVLFLSLLEEQVMQVTA